MAKKQESAKLSVEFSLKGIDLVDFALTRPNTPTVDTNAITFDIGIQHRVNKENKMVLAIIHVDIYSKEKDFKFGSITVNYAFEVKDLEHFVSKNKDLFDFPEPFITSINSIAISTTRGILFSKLKGTFLHHSFLPIIDPRSFHTEK